MHGVCFIVGEIHSAHFTVIECIIGDVFEEWIKKKLSPLLQGEENYSLYEVQLWETAEPSCVFSIGGAHALSPAV